PEGRRAASVRDLLSRTRERRVRREVGDVLAPGSRTHRRYGRIPARQLNYGTSTGQRSVQRSAPSWSAGAAASRKIAFPPVVRESASAARITAALVQELTSTGQRLPSA